MRAAALALGLLCASPASAQMACPTGLHPVRTAELFFGLDEGGHIIGDSDWSAFVDSEVTPRFPNGLTIWDARGQWRAPNGALSKEPSKVLLIILSEKGGAPARLAALIEAYKVRFHQQSVLLVEHRSCAKF